MVAAIARPLSVPLTATADAEALGAMAGEGLTGDFPPMGGAAGAALGAAAALAVAGRAAAAALAAAGRLSNGVAAVAAGRFSGPAPAAAGDSAGPPLGAAFCSAALCWAT